MMHMTVIAETSKLFIIESNASGRPALFKKLENIVAPNNNANNFAAKTLASLKTPKYSLNFKFPEDIKEKSFQRKIGGVVIIIFN